MFCSCSNWLPIDAYVDVTIVVSIATRKIPKTSGPIYRIVEIEFYRSFHGQERRGTDHSNKGNMRFVR